MTCVCRGSALLTNGIPFKSTTNPCIGVHVHTVYDHCSNIILLMMYTPAVQYHGPSRQVTRRIVVTDSDLRDTGKLTNMQRWLALFCV